MKRFLPALALSVIVCLAQKPPTNTTEVTTKDESVVFKSKVTLVLVPVVVRDKNGKAVSTLHKEDFQLFDKGKPQAIVKFSVEKPGGTVISRAPETGNVSTERVQPVQPEAPAIIAPNHFVGLLFDDVHVNYADLQNTRVAAQKFIASSLSPVDRVAIFTTSGHDTLDFTDDRDLLDRTLLKLSPHPLARALTQDQECPKITFYDADRVINKDDKDALALAAGEVARCWYIVPYDAAVEVARAESRNRLRLGEQEIGVVFDSLRDAVQRLARMPGQRTLILASPGFFLLEDRFRDQSAAVDLAIRSGVVINSLNARGLFTIGFDVSKPVTNGQRWQNQERNAAFAESGVLADLAAGTGGTYIQNTNDLTKGFQQLGTAEPHYILGFSPQNLKLDGAFRAIKVTVKTPGFTTHARPGYYAPTHLATAEEDAKEEITDALFSTDEIREIPIDIHTQFFKPGDSEARLAIISRVDIKKLRFAKADGRNNDDVRIVSALFDRNGNFLQSVTKTVQLRLLDETLQNKLDTGISVRSDFKVAPGTYVIRLVVRDSEGQTMAARNGAVEIP